MQWPFAYSQGHKARQANPKRPARAAASVLLMPCAGDPLELDWASKLGSENMLSIAIPLLASIGESSVSLLSQDFRRVTPHFQTLKTLVAARAFFRP